MSMKMVSPGVYEPTAPDGHNDYQEHNRLLNVSGITPEFRHTKRLSTFEVVAGREKGFEAACQFIRGEVDPPLMLLYGEPGRSKTHLAVAIGLAWISQMKEVRYYWVSDLLDDLRAGHRVSGEYNPRTTDSILKYCKDVTLLILDDMGMGNLTDWAYEKLDTIVNHRYEKRLATVITANTLDLSDRIIDRCREGLIVQLEGISYREIIQLRKEAEKKPARVRKGKGAK